MAKWLDNSLSNTEASGWQIAWIIPCPVAEWLDYHCPIQKHLCDRVVGLFIVQYRSISVVEWLDYSLSNTEAYV